MEEDEDSKKASKAADDDDDESEVAEATDEEKGFRAGFSDALAILVAHCPAALHTSASSASSVTTSAAPSSSALRYPLYELLTLLLHLLNHVPSHHSNVSRALLSLASALLLSDVPALLTDDGIFSVNVDVRAIVLDALSLVNTNNGSDSDADQHNRQMLTYRVYIAAQDAEEEVREKAVALLTQLSLHPHCRLPHSTAPIPVPSIRPRPLIYRISHRHSTRCVSEKHFCDRRLPSVAVSLVG